MHLPQRAIELTAFRPANIVRREQRGLRMIRVLLVVNVHGHDHEFALGGELLGQLRNPAFNVNSRLSARKPADDKIMRVINDD